MAELPPDFNKYFLVLWLHAISVYDDSMQMRILAGGTVAFVCVLVLGEFKLIYRIRVTANLTVFKYIRITVIVASVWFLRSKSQDELDKKTNNHLPLPLDYASNEGKFFHSIVTLSPHLQKRVPLCAISKSYPLLWHILPSHHHHRNT